MSGSLAGQRILLGITGGIAAYKSPELARRLVERGAEVRAVLTATAAEFVGAASFDAASQCLTGTPMQPDDAESLGQWARLIVVAPATADFIARLAAGRADDLLTGACLASSARVVIAPAMNPLMWSHAATQANLRRMRERGVRWLGPAYGEVAEGEVGVGRMMEPRDIVTALCAGAKEGYVP
ncbi:MAG: hypothetical protein GWN84_19955 [Gammaproteobacteria bacterium]|nr:hypothetical protein [Gammaproteobacteria bacterium]NIR85096.1 hypothetical protein [Gammaproteobacteria bacterium]NIR92006.1 hypothetical protein [Gammaproteobacteria bacterium]NIU06145.1 hypothetical protein [Gammaproteobacteria bacterium]NIV53088.1 hypothetical protein [Gammaproteobacteria bacterium]